jgi:FkbM family methyltransferase
MNNIFTIFKVEENGVIHFTFTGEDTQESYEVSIVDENTGLTVHKSQLNLVKGSSWWISTGETNARRLKNVLFKIKYNGQYFIEKVEMFGQSRYLVINSKKLELSNIGDDIFPTVGEIFYDKVYERDFVRLNTGDVVVDIGANYGIFSLYAQLFNPKKVYAVEPVKVTFDNMVKNVSNYEVICINKAISDKNGYEKFTVTDVNANNFSSKNTDSYHPSGMVSEEIVETITINQLISDYNIDKIDFLKVDCEGGELDLFETINKEYLKYNIKKIAIEYHSNKIYETIINILKENNFTIEDILGNQNMGLIYAYNSFFIR